MNKRSTLYKRIRTKASACMEIVLLENHQCDTDMFLQFAIKKLQYTVEKHVYLEIILREYYLYVLAIIECYKPMCIIDFFCFGVRHVSLCSHLIGPISVLPPEQVTRGVTLVMNEPFMIAKTVHTKLKLTWLAS